VIECTEGLLEMRRAIFADHQQAICQTTLPFTTHAIEPLANGLRDSRAAGNRLPHAAWARDRDHFRLPVEELYSIGFDLAFTTQAERVGEPLLRSASPRSH